MRRLLWRIGLGVLAVGVAVASLSPLFMLRAARPAADGTREQLLTPVGLAQTPALARAAGNFLAGDEGQRTAMRAWEYLAAALDWLAAEQGGGPWAGVTLLALGMLLLAAGAVLALAQGVGGLRARTRTAGSFTRRGLLLLLLWTLAWGCLLVGTTAVNRALAAAEIRASMDLLGVTAVRFAALPGIGYWGLLAMQIGVVLLGHSGRLTTRAELRITAFGDAGGAADIEAEADEWAE